MPRRILGYIAVFCILLGALIAPAVRITAQTQSHAALSGHLWTARHPASLAEVIGGFPFIRPSAASLALDPNAGGRLWAAMTSSAATGAPPPGLYTSADAGVTWTRPATQPDDIDAPSPLIVTNPITPELLLASFERGVRDQIGGVQRSDNGGLDWTTAITDVRATSIAWSADGLHVYAATIGVAGNPNGGPLRSDDGGVHWQRMTSPTSGVQSLTPKLFAVAADNAQHVWTIAGGGLFESVDAGASWTLRLPTGASLKTVALSPDALTLLAGGESGLHRSTDGGQTWAAVPLPPTEYGAALDLLVWSPVDPLLVYAARRSTQLWRSDDGGVQWQPDSIGLPASIARDPVAIVFDPTAADRLFVSLAYDRIYTALPLADQHWLPLVGR